MGKTMPQVSLNWLLSNPAVTSPIIGARNIEQLKENMGSLGWQISSNDIRRINEASAMDITYPYDIKAERQQKA
ncbi:oxidoreductase protein, partial [mine drainage metagenome]